jgi:carbon-monoxide dehydrogenase medium subunit
MIPRSDAGRQRSPESFFIPGSLDELLALLKERNIRNESPPIFVAGATDWTVRLRNDENLRFPEDAVFADLSGIEELKGITPGSGEIRIGATATMTSVSENESVRRYAACLAQAASSVGSWQIRNRATLGGNLANASPAADTPAALAALDAFAVLVSSRGERELPVCAVPAGLNATALEPGELITAFRIPLSPIRISAFKKVGSRSQMSIARLNLAVSAVPADGKLENVRVFAGTLGSAVLRCSSAEKILSQMTVENLSSDRNGKISSDLDEFREALVAAVEEAIPGRSTLPYKRSAIRALGLDVTAMLREAVKKEELK